MALTIVTLIQLLLLTTSATGSFITNQPKTTSFIRASPDEDLGSSVLGIGFTVSVSKPLGIVFSENPDPYLGLVIDDVALGLNGGAAGMRAGDNLVAVNGEVVIGKYFDTAMDLLKESDAVLELQLFRGSAEALYSTLGLRDAYEFEEEEDDLETDDDDYEAPVIDDIEPERAVTTEDLVRAAKKLGNFFTTKDEVKEDKPKKKGLFDGMFGGEAVQLDGDDASGTNKWNRKL